MLQESGQTELLATVAHEMRNPLAAIQAAVRVLDKKDQTIARREQVRDLIDRQVLRIARLSDDLLSAGYMATGKLELRKERIDLRDVVNHAAEACRPQLEAGNFLVLLLLPPEPVTLEADPIRMTQVLTNLLDNSAKYSAHYGMIVVSVEDRRSEVTIRVVDHGIGIPTELLPRIFDLFVQADHPPSRSVHGMGIGLSVVRRIVELHQGTVEAFSAGPELGSTFTIHLPRNA
ncbi:MAG TPA: HAMP domain-containing sensor histidine kinase [Steroidobacteraceae bacterium]